MKGSQRKNKDFQSTTFKRSDVEIQDFARFKKCPDNFEQQFSSSYKARFSLLKHRVAEKARIKWGLQYEILEIVDLTIKDEAWNETCIIIGTLYKHQELKPSILKEISNELQLAIQPPSVSNYNSNKDCLFLEDDVQRIKLSGNLPILTVTTGIVCALLGRDLKNGIFMVEDWCFPGFHPKMSGSPISPKNKGNILLVSGFDFSNNVDCIAIDLLQEWITGMAGNVAEQNKASQIVAVIIAGNSIRSSAETFTREDYFIKNSFNSSSIVNTILTVQRFDNFLSQIVENCHVILMPGEFDPSSHLIPQRPLHPQMLKKCSRFKTLHPVTNPWIGSIQSKIIVGSSGQPIQDIIRSSGQESSPIEWLERTLLWQHMAPTSPDTLDAYPYFEQDPFVMEECPDIYFVGNMEKFETKILKGDAGQKIRLICLPEFSKSHEAVLVNLQTLNADVISFEISS